MKAPSLKTPDPDICLVEPNIERDAQLSFNWLDGQVGRETLKSMGVPDKNNHPSTLEKERERIKGFIAGKGQLNWMIKVGEKVVGSIWVDLESTADLPGPAVHMMVGDPGSRNSGIGGMVIKPVINYLNDQDYKRVFSRRLTSNKIAAKLLIRNDFEEIGKSYSDKDGLTWQNVVLNLKH